MQMLRRSALRLLALAMLLSGTARAQSSQSLLSQPSGGQLTLDGPIKVTGMSPLILEERLRGDYILTASKPGFVTQKARLRFPDGGGPGQPAGSSPFSSFGGVVRTLAVPGAGQWAAGNRGQGAAFMLAEGTAVGMALKSDGDLRAAQQDYARFVDRQNSGQTSTLTPADQVELTVAIRRASNRVDNAKAARRGWAIMAGAAWAYSVIDQAFLQGGLDVRPSGYDTLRVLMTQVARTGAVTRSLFMPGAGQAYAGHPARGAWLLVISGGMTGAALAGEQHLDRTRSELDEAQLRYDQLRARSSDVALLNAARDNLNVRYSQAQDSRRFRNVLWAAAGMVWGLNVLDAMVMEIPGEPGALGALAGRDGMYATIQPGALRLGFRRGF